MRSLTMVLVLFALVTACRADLTPVSTERVEPPPVKAVVQDEQSDLIAHTAMSHHDTANDLDRTEVEPEPRVRETQELERTKPRRKKTSPKPFRSPFGEWEIFDAKMHREVSANAVKLPVRREALKGSLRGVDKPPGQKGFGKLDHLDDIRFVPQQ